MKRIILQDGRPPVFEELWTVGEVLQMAQQLAAWVERLQVNSQPAPEAPPEPAAKGK